MHPPVTSVNKSLSSSDPARSVSLLLSAGMHLEAKAGCEKRGKYDGKSMMEMTSPITSAEDLEKVMKNKWEVGLKGKSGRAESGFDQCVPSLMGISQGKRRGGEGKGKNSGKGGASLTLLLADEEGDSRVPAMRS